MDRISSVSQISRLIKSRFKQDKAAARSKSPGKSSEVDQPENNENSHTQSEISEDVIVSSLLALPEQQRYGNEGIQILIHGVMNWKFGENASTDILLQKGANKIVDSIVNNSKARETTEKLIREITDIKQSD